MSMLWIFFCFIIISACFFFFLYKDASIFQVFTVLGVIRAEILFSMMKGDIFVSGSFSFDSRMMNLGYGSSLSESHSIWGLFAWVFVLTEAIKVLNEFH